eukprot:TRINITY_DN9977_c1_g1_i6.p1 TRINITY_DN9977_c1_g1~~TRINITY_DN9977_c1_g1_i6.p1  ORF type:complete len:191 (+),score=20.28 TRINITY_DN9977_c1_g1_i6:187-759(+)
MADVVARRRRRNYLRRNRIFRDRRHPFDNYDDEELYKKFRFDRRHIIEITDDVTEVLQLANRLRTLTPILQVLLTLLRFYATGTYQDVCGELIGVSPGTANRTINRVTSALFQTAHNWIIVPEISVKPIAKKENLQPSVGFQMCLVALTGHTFESRDPLRTSNSLSGGLCACLLDEMITGHLFVALTVCT